jgi:NAD-specific glutamate dehydrogenase
MNCIECGEPLQTETCAACADEKRMYAAYRGAIEVPPMWSGIEERVRRPRWRVPLAAAAMIGLMMMTATLFLLRAPRATSPSHVAAVAAAHYRVAIAKLERRADPLLPQLTSAIGEAERAVSRQPDDPVAVTSLVAAYDAKLQLLRTTVDD